MKKLFTIATIVFGLFSAHGAFAHENHTNALSDKQAIQVGAEKVGLLVSSESKIEGALLDANWKTVSTENGKLFQKGPGYYIVSYTQPKSDKTLYLLLDGVGKLYNANFTGKFSELE